MNSTELNVFKGKNAILDFLNPDKNIYLPMVEISEKLNPFYKNKIRIYAKLMNALPMANVKSMPAYNMLSEAEKNKKLINIHTLVENSSGNTVFSLAVVGRHFGIKRTKSFSSHEVAPGKIDLLRFFGVDVQINKEPICPDPADRTSGIYKAKILGKKKGWYNPGQYDNPANPAAHEKWTGPQIWQQMNGKVDILCAGMGTTGTLYGTAKYLKKQNRNIKTIGVTRLPNNPVPGVRTPSLLQQIAFDWKSYVDQTIEIGTRDSFITSLELCRHGLLVGPSSGFALAGLKKYLDAFINSSEYKNHKGEISAVFVCPDSPFPYIDEYFSYLDKSYFPVIKNEHLLINKKNAQTRNITLQKIARKPYEMEAEKVYQMIYGIRLDKNWEISQSFEDFTLQPNMVLVDIRTQQEFSDHHLFGSIRMNYKNFVVDVRKTAESLNNKKVFLICASGHKTLFAASALRKFGIEAYSIKDGTIGWSKSNFPRYRPAKCNIR